MEIPRFKEMRRAYSFDEVALVPGRVTINPEQVNLDLQLGSFTFSAPVLASAMDAVVDPKFAILFNQMGGLAVLNLEGVQTRYEKPDEVLLEISQAPQNAVTELLQKVYSAPIQENLIGERIQTIKQAGVCAVSVTPTLAKRFAPLAAEAGADIIVVQSTVTTARHVSKSYRGLIFDELIQSISAQVLVGNCVSYTTAMDLMEEGIAGLLVGVGPGAACTTREVLGVGVPQVTATMDCAAARNDYFRRTGRYVPIITDGGIRTGGDLAKAIAAGADGVMLGTPLAQAEEAPGRGYNWGMATPHASLPRGTRIRVDTRGPLQKILFGPTSVTDGTENLIGALRTAMGVCSAQNIREMQQAEMVIAPAIKTEGKVFQLQGPGAG